MNLKGVQSVTANAKEGIVKVASNDIDISYIKEAINQLGFKVVDD